MLKYEIKDITTVTGPAVIMHGCNCLGVMGGGVALSIKNKWPEAFKAYKKVCDSFMGNEAGLLGVTQIVDVSEPQNWELGDEQHIPLYIANAMTQVHFGRGGPHGDPAAIKETLDHVCYFAQQNGLPVYTVKIGSLRGGLDWDAVVLPIFNHVQSLYPTVEIIICDI